MKDSTSKRYCEHISPFSLDESKPSAGAAYAEGPNPSSIIESGIDPTQGKGTTRRVPLGRWQVIAVTTGPEALPDIPDLGVIVTPATTVLGIIAALGEKDCRVVVVLTTGLTHENGLRQAMLDAAKPCIVLEENTAMLRMCREFGFSISG